MLREALDHVKFVDLLGVVLGLGVVLRAALLLLFLHLLQQLPGAVIQRQDLVGHVAGPQGLRGAGEAQLAEDLAPDGLHPLLLDVLQVECGAGGERQADGGQAQEAEEEQSPLQGHLPGLGGRGDPPGRSAQAKGRRRRGRRSWPSGAWQEGA